MTDRKAAQLAVWFLKENGAYDKFIANAKRTYADWGGSFVDVVRGSHSDWLCGWFIWYKTAEGEQYWLDLYGKWMSLYDIVK